MASQFDATLANLGIGRTQTGPVVQQSATTTLGQADFLRLMTAQLKNQDPFEPVDNTQMVAQMASFSSLAAQTEMNTTLKSIADKLGATGTADALAYVGRNVLTAGNVAYPRAGGGLNGAVELPADVQRLTVTVQNANGQVLRTLELGAQAKGTAEFDWDGSTDGGEPAGDGPFTITAAARGPNGSVAVTPLVWAPVGSVSMTGGAPVLTLPGLGQVPATAVRAIG